MNKLFPLLILVLAACAPAPQEPVDLEPIAPAELEEALPEVPQTGEEAAAETGLPEVPGAPEESGLPEVPGAADAAPEAAETPAAARPAPQGTISISADNENFVTSAAGELNPVTVTAGGTFYLQLDFTDPDGVTAAQVELRNSASEGTLPTGPFTVAASDCETALVTAPTDLTCTLTVNVAPDAQNIAEAGEVAYAFRPIVTDAAGNSELAFTWAYLVVEPL